LKAFVERTGRILTDCVGFSRAFTRAAVVNPSSRWTAMDTHRYRGMHQPPSRISRTTPGTAREDQVGHPFLNSGLSVEQAGSRGGAPPIVFQGHEQSGTNSHFVNWNGRNEIMPMLTIQIIALAMSVSAIALAQSHQSGSRKILIKSKQQR